MAALKSTRQHMHVSLLEQAGKPPAPVYAVATIAIRSAA
jgi:hypothetical protein